MSATALTALLALALGIGSATIIFSVFYNLLLDPTRHARVRQEGMPRPFSRSQLRGGF